MEESEAEEKFREVANSRSNNSIAWTGLAITQFTLIVSIFSAFGLVTSVTFQLASALFLVSGIIFTLSYGLYESAGSSYKLRLPVNARPYKIWKLRAKKDEKCVPNPREIFVKQAESCVTWGILIWCTGISILLWDLRMYIALPIFILGVIVAYLFMLPRSSLVSKR